MGSSSCPSELDEEYMTVEDEDNSETSAIPTQEASNKGLMLNCAQKDVWLSHDSMKSLSQSAAGNNLDPIHGALCLHKLCDQIIETSQFQRLRCLKQLGVACFNKFTSAEHSRLSHSLGVSHLAFKMVRNLLSAHGPALGLTERDIRNVALAGLCHDLGHGPFSHVFEKEFLHAMGLTSWKHETMSLHMLQLLLEDAGIKGVSEEDVVFIGQMIKGVKPEDRTGEKKFLYDIISNDYNGVDVDRMDYLQRDARMCGTRPLACDFEALLSDARVVDDQICYPYTPECRANIWHVFSGRMQMFQDVYTCWQTKASELMLVDALVHADEAIRFSKRIHEAKTFMSLDDSLKNEIQYYDIRHPEVFAELDEQQRDHLRVAQRILRRLDMLDLYPCCGQVAVPEHLILEGRWEPKSNAEATRPGEHLAAAFNAEELLACLEPCTVEGPQSEQNVECLQHLGGLKRQLLLDHNKLDFTKGGVDPMAQVGFYKLDANGCYVKCHASQQDLDALPGRPRCFKVRSLRLFVRDPAYRTAAHQAFVNWSRKHLGLEVVVDLPSARPRFSEPLVAALLEREVMADATADPQAGGAAWGSKWTSTTSQRPKKRRLDTEFGDVTPESCRDRSLTPSPSASESPAASADSDGYQKQPLEGPRVATPAPAREGRRRRLV